MAKDVIMPVLGMNQDTAVLLSWLKQEGEQVQEGEPIMEVETDKATMELDAPATGTLANVVARAGEEVRVGSVIAVILADGEAAGVAGGASGGAPARDRAAAPAAGDDAGAAQRAGSDGRAGAPASIGGAPARSANDAGAAGAAGAGSGALRTGVAAEGAASTPVGGTVPASPKARRLAAERGIDLAPLRGAGRGPEGAVLAADVLQAASAATRATAAATTAVPLSTWPTFHREIDAGPLLKALSLTRAARPAREGTPTIEAGDLLARFLGAVWARYPLPGADGASPATARLRYRRVADGRVHEALIEGVGRMDVFAIASAREAVPHGGADTTGVASELSLLDLSRVRAELSGDPGVSPGVLVQVVAGRLDERTRAPEGTPEPRTTLTLRLAFDPARVELGAAAAWSDRVIELVEDPPALALLY